MANLDLFSKTGFVNKKKKKKKTFDKEVLQDYQVFALYHIKEW